MEKKRAIETERDEAKEKTGTRWRRNTKRAKETELQT